LLVFTKVAGARFSAAFKGRILDVYSLFPELQDRQVKCGFIRKGSRLAGSARSWTSPQQIALQPDASSTTIAHELTHLLQGNGVPYGEKSCDIWALSRLEAADEQPYYILRHWKKGRWLRHRESVRRLCIQAIEVRRTNKTYIKWLSGQLRQLR
jgi:hypothetical protein